MLKTYDVIIVDSGIELEHKYFQNLSYHPDSVFFEMNEKKEILLQTISDMEQRYVL